MKKPSKLKLLLVTRGLVQADVAKLAGLSESRLSRIVRGRVEPRAFELKNLAQALGVQREEVQG